MELKRGILYKTIIIVIIVCFLFTMTFFSVVVTSKENKIEKQYEKNVVLDEFIILSKPVYVIVKFFDNVTNNCTISFDVTQYVSKPPDSDKRPNQFVSMLSFTSSYTILTDTWDQEIARWHTILLDKGDKTSVGFLFKGTLYDVNYSINPANVTDDFPPDLDPRYLQDAAMYDIYSNEIQNAAQAAVGNETNLYWKARNISKYVQDELYHHNDGTWDNATITLSNGHGSCSEYSWLFIALCRASGVPARYVGSTWYKEYEPLPYLDQKYHRWPQVYLPPYGWVPVDPNRSDKNGTHDYHKYFGMIESNLLVTQICGGPSRYLEWYYNSYRIINPDPEVGEVKRNRGGLWLMYKIMYPLTPLTPIGPIWGKPNNNYDYKTSTYDNSDSTLWYWWDWGDGTNTGWIGPYESNETCEASHAWKTDGDYQVKVKARNRDGWESYWSDPLEITIPRTRTSSYIWFECLLEHFPLLKRLINLIR